jgi:hypothetical protein
MRRLAFGAAAAALALSGTVLAAGSASANSCAITSPWGHKGYYMCGTNLYAGKADWNQDGQLDEMFVIAPDRTIWHDWKNSGGWKVMPGNGRADDVTGTNPNDASGRCVWVYVDGSGTHWKNCFYSGSWHTWVYDPG